MTLLGDRYRLGESIGSGGMSDVYAADDTLLGRDVAIKMLKLDMARDDGFRERFRREAQNSAKLNHPNIVAVYDTGETPVDGVSVPYIVMERVYGQTLRDIVRGDGPLSTQEAAELLIPVCDALQASHDAGIIHRDIKPANIMVTNTGSVKVMDFGIARALDDATSAMTQTSAVIGTAQYLSPEQARGKPADARSDVYALGCVLYETVTGGPPFDGESPFAVAYQHVQEDPEAPSERISDPDLTPTAAVNIDAVVLTAMAKHPADRYETIAEMGSDLGRLARGAVTQAARAHVAVPGEDDRASHRTAAATVPPTQAATTSPAPTRAVARKKQDNRYWWLVGLLSLALIGGGTALALNFLPLGEPDSTQTTASSPPVAPDMIVVPDLVGWQEADATAELEGLGFVVDKREEPSPDVPAGNVISLNPGPGSELREGTTITMTVSTGRETTAVPDVVGMSPQEASAALEAAGLTLRSQVLEENSDTIAAGLITAQSPPASTEIAKGSEVTITVSLGPDMVNVPSLTGMSVTQAEETLRSMGLDVQIVQEDSLRPAGEVLRIDAPGAQVPAGTTVTLVASNGMLFEMPDITRMAPDAAVNELRRSGWTGTRQQFVVGEPTPTASLVDAGLISFASPAADETVRKDATVNVRLWEFDVAGGLEEALPRIPRP